MIVNYTLQVVDLLLSGGGEEAAKKAEEKMEQFKTEKWIPKPTKKLNYTRIHQGATKRLEKFLDE
eukprot:CAMPEP_0170497998 /NCGR_PEP_ID=MMETSP0208-20121228/26465_1 /TAXON_ID=197538 /ORGANISM="Strombidium inclinatum, Strain S3" /LENGTH=64 /DNA_ID=CAMNT_0010775017 /DNA_START=223 /DNA_END=417 /DNA_ORIENTATION=-